MSSISKMNRVLPVRTLKNTATSISVRCQSTNKPAQYRKVSKADILGTSVNPAFDQCLYQSNSDISTSSFATPRVPSTKVVNKAVSAPAREFSSSSNDTDAASTQQNALQPLPGACTMSEIMECVVKVFVTSSSPNYLQPWQSRALTDHMGSGFIIKGRRILTNAHVIADAVQVMVRRPGSPHKYIARVVAAGHECDLALLDVEDDGFWEEGRYSEMDLDQAEAQAKEAGVEVSDQEVDIEYDDDVSESELPVIGTDRTNSNNALPPPLLTSVGSVFAPDNYLLPGETSLSNQGFEQEEGVLYLSRQVPLLQESVVVVGYPMGGDNLCITQGVVSRIEPVHYAHTGSYLLAIQIDAAINPGNSGGPAFVNGRVVGVAFQNVTNASSVGYIIPTSIILHFLKDVERGGYPVVDKSLSRATVLNAQSDTTPQGTLGFCSFGLNCQDTFNPALQRSLGMTSNNNNNNKGKKKTNVVFGGKLQGHNNGNKSSVASGSYTVNQLPAAYVHYRDPALVNAYNTTPTADGDVDADADGVVDESVLSPVSLAPSITKRIGIDQLSGVVVIKISHVSPCRGILQRGDVLLSIDGHQVASDGTIHYRGHERIGFDFLFSLKHRGDTSSLTYLRFNRKTNEYELLTNNVTMRPAPALVPSSGYDKHPSYLVFSGMVFVPLTVPYLCEFGKDWYTSAPKELVDIASSHSVLFPSQQSVVLAQVLPDTVTLGYNVLDAAVKRVDGIYIKNMAHLRAVIQRCVVKNALKWEALSLVDTWGMGLLDLINKHGDAAVVDGVVSFKDAAVNDTFNSLLKDHSHTNPVEGVSEGESLLAAATRLTTLLSQLSEVLRVRTGAPVHYYADLHLNNDNTPMTEAQIAALKTGSSADAVAGSDVLSGLLSTVSASSPYREYMHTHGMAHGATITYLAGEDGLLVGNNHEFARKDSSVHAPDYVKKCVTDVSADTVTVEADNTSTTAADEAANAKANVNIYNVDDTVMFTTTLDVNGSTVSSDITAAAWKYCFGTVPETPESGKLSSTVGYVGVNDTISVELTDHRIVVLNIMDACQSHFEIIRKHNVHNDCSVDLNTSIHNC